MANALEAALELSRQDGTLWELHHSNGKRVLEFVGPKGYEHGWKYVGGPGLPAVRIGDHVRVNQMAGKQEGQVIGRAGDMIHVKVSTGTQAGKRIQTHVGMVTHKFQGEGAPPVSGKAPAASDRASLVAHLVDVHQQPMSSHRGRTLSELQSAHHASHQSSLERSRGLSNHDVSSMRHRKSTLESVQKMGGGSATPGERRPTAPAAEKPLRIAGQRMTVSQTRDFNGLSSTNKDIYEERRQEGYGHADAMKGLTPGSAGVTSVSEQKVRSVLRNGGHPTSKKLTGTSIRSEATGSRLSEYTHGHVVDSNVGGQPRVYMSGGRDKRGGGKILDGGTLKERQATLDKAGIATTHVPASPGMPEHLRVTGLKRAPKTGTEAEKTRLRNQIASAKTAGLSEKGSPAAARLKSLEALTPAQRDSYDEAKQEGLSHSDAMKLAKAGGSAERAGLTGPGKPYGGAAAPAMHTQAAAKEPVGSSAAHSELLKARTAARAAYPKGHPERLKAERAVRQSRKARRAGAGGGGETTRVGAGTPRTSRRRRVPATVGATSAPEKGGGKSIAQRRAEAERLLPRQQRTYNQAKLKGGTGHERAIGIARGRPVAPRGTAGRKRQIAEEKAFQRPGRVTVAKAQSETIDSLTQSLVARGWSKARARKLAEGRILHGNAIPQYAPGRKGPRQR
jgi:hypothetical protein